MGIAPWLLVYLCGLSGCRLLGYPPGHPVSLMVGEIGRHWRFQLVLALISPPTALWYGWRVIAGGALKAACIGWLAAVVFALGRWTTKQ